jgi:hypothetical protein
MIQKMNEVSDLLVDLLDQPLARAEFTYPQQMELHFGEMHAYESMGEIYSEGQFALLTAGSSWQFLNAGGEQLTGLGLDDELREPEEEEGIEEALHSLYGARITALTCNEQLALEIVFTDGVRLRVDPGPSDTDSAWEIFAPDNRHIEATAEGELVLARSDQPESSAEIIDVIRGPLHLSA